MSLFGERAINRISRKNIGIVIIRCCIVLALIAEHAVPTIVPADGKIKRFWWRSGETEIFYNFFWAGMRSG